MAKSLRSKRKRKMRAVKRVRYGEKELVKLRETAAKLNLDPSELSNSVLVTNAKAVKAAAREVSKDVVAEGLQEEQMQVEGKRYDKKTMQDENGQYPPWYNKRRVRQMQLQNKKLKKKKATGKKRIGGKGRHR